MARVLMVSWEYPPVIEGGLARAVCKLAEALAAQSGVAAAARLRGELDTARRALVALDARIARDYPSYRRLISAEGVTLGEVQRALAADEALVNYLVGVQESFAVVVRRDRTVVVPLALSRTTLASLVSARTETVIRALRPWEKDGVLATRDGAFRIDDVATLEACAAEGAAGVARSQPGGIPASRAARRARSRRVTRLRTTAPPTAPDTTKPTRGARTPCGSVVAA